MWANTPEFTEQSWNTRAPSPARAPRPKAELEVAIRWGFATGDSVTTRATRTLAQEERKTQMGHGNACGPIVRVEFPKARGKGRGR